MATSFPKLIVILAQLTIITTLATLGSGCAENRPTEGIRATSLLLDFTPNAVHSGIYLAVDHKFDRSNGLELTVRRPAAATDTIKLLQSGQVDSAIVDIHDLALAKQRGIDLVGVMAIVQRPLAALFTEHEIKKPTQLEGKIIGLTGLPSDDAVTHSIMENAGADWNKAKKVTLGFSTVKALIGGRVDAAIGFWNVEGVALKKNRTKTDEFRVDRWGAPKYPELILTVKGSTLRQNRPMVKKLVKTLQRGYQTSLAQPQSAIRSLQNHQSGYGLDLLKAQLSAVRSAFYPPSSKGPIGSLNRNILKEWANWEQRFGIVETAPDVNRLFDRSIANS